MEQSNLKRHGTGFIDLSGTATCTSCCQTKPNSEFKFYKNRVNPSTNLCLYVNKKCNSCIRAYSQHKKTSKEQLNLLNIARPIPSVDNPYRCDCCNKNITTTRTLQLDHCHKTGTFRGWLCKECNISMGNLGDSIECMVKVIKYLNFTEKKSIEEICEMLSTQLTI